MQIMKLDRLETHDRFEYFTKQSFDIAECCQNLIDQLPFGNIPFYIFAHTRTEEDGVTKRLIWQPRLTKPKAETNSMLFKAYPKDGTIKIIWMIPATELWSQFRKGTITENQIVLDSILTYIHNKKSLERSEPDDLNDDQIDMIYRELSKEARRKKAKQDSLVDSSISSAIKA